MCIIITHRNGSLQQGTCSNHIHVQVCTLLITYKKKPEGFFFPLYCDDHSSLSSTTAVHELFRIYVVGQNELQVNNYDFNLV